ncbi:hypothetical protein [Curtobacterium sp. MCJR17_043]|uniref:hypothetical protein n=1 Tax=Curtobacterium sp. MCJR17_043 TaxID=2175660 RepID=UPI0032E86E21
MHWGLDYLFGLVDDQADFRAFWAHTIRDERQALLDFLAFIAERRERYPDMHIYHYAAYERTHLLSLAARHGVGGGRGGRPAARRCLGRPVPDRAEGPGGRQPQLLDQEARAAVHGRRPATERRDERGRQHHCLRRRDRGAPQRRPRRGAAAARPGRRLQRLRLPVDTAPPRLAARPPRRTRAGRHHNDRARRAAAHPGRARAEPGDRRAHRVPRRRRRPRPHARPDRVGARRGGDRLPPPRGEDLLAGPLRPAPQPRRRVGRHAGRPGRRARLRRAGLGDAAARPLAVTRDPVVGDARARLAAPAGRLAPPRLRRPTPGVDHRPGARSEGCDGPRLDPGGVGQRRRHRGAAPRTHAGRRGRTARGLPGRARALVATPGEAAARRDRGVGRRGARCPPGDAARPGARPPPAGAAARNPRAGRRRRHGGCRGGDPARTGPVVPGDPGASRHG